MVEIAFVALLVLAGPWLLAFVALGRANRAQRDLARARGELAEAQTHAFIVDKKLAALDRRLEELSQRRAPQEAPVEPERRAEPPEPESIPEQRTTPVMAQPVPVIAPPAEPPPPTPAEPGIAPPSPIQPPSPAPSFQLEQLLGVRGAAILGGIVLALAALLFFQYSIEKGLIPPPVRVALVVFVGLGCLVGSERLLARYAITANALAGAGAVALYGAFWAAKALYELIPMGVAFVLMALVTTTCCLLAVRRSSLLVAILGLVGGFATPLLLSSGQDRPIGLFGYILVLDAGLLYVATRRRWTQLSLLSLVATVVLEAAWVRERLDADRIWLAIGIVALFAAVFVLGARKTAREGLAALAAPAGGVLLPYAFALYFAANSTLNAPLVAVALLLALLGAGCAFLALRFDEARILPIAGASATVAVVSVWVLTKDLTPARVWEASACAVGLALVYHLFAEMRGAERASKLSAWAPIVADGGLLISLIAGAELGDVSTVWPWLAGWIGLVVLLYRLAALAAPPVLQTLGAIGLGIALDSFLASYGHRDGFPALSSYLLAEGALAAAALLVAIARRRADAGPHAAHAAAVFSLLIVLGAMNDSGVSALSPELALGGTALIALTGILAATLFGYGVWLCALAAALALTHASYTDVLALGSSETPGWALRAFAIQGACVVAMTFYPRLAVDRFRTSRPAWYAAALAGAAWFFPLRRLYEQCVGSSSIGVLPVALGALAMASLTSARGAFSPADPVRRSAVVWFSAVALGFVSVAIPLQLDKHWITVGWAVEGAAILALWLRLDHPGLKYLAAGLYALSAARLVLLASELGEYDRGGNRIFNFTLYTYWVPIAALLIGSAWLRAHEVARARKREEPWYRAGHPVVGVFAAGCALVLVFVWINVAIANWFTPGTHAVITFERNPARDLATSLAWAVYAVALLAIGTRMSSAGLRGVSLAVLLLTIGKVFLYDLSNLEDLYRVVSLLGLAISLIGVSLAYQRFVFRAPRKEKPL